MISERANDGIERSREQWFKRYNSKDPEKGRAQTVRDRQGSMEARLERSRGRVAGARPR